MDEDSNHWQEEIDRLNYIIDLLIKENQQLRSVLPETLAPTYTSNPVTQELLKENILNWLISSNPIKENVLKQVISSNLKEGNVSNQPVSSNLIKESDINQLISSNLKERIVSNEPVSSNPGKGDIQNEPVFINPTKEVLSNEVVLANQQKGIVLNEPGALNQEKESAAKQVSVFAALKVMRTDKVSASRTSVKNSLKLLQHLANNPQNNTRQLSKATGMSESGLSKRLSALRKQGYVTKLKVRHYVLTQKALDVLGL